MSTRAAGLKRFMYAADEWQRPQNSGMSCRFGAPTYGFGLNFGSIAPPTSSPSFGSGLPPWQSWQESPTVECTSTPKCRTFAFAASSNNSPPWQWMHDVSRTAGLAGGGAAIALIANIAIAATTKLILIAPPDSCCRG